ncbi:MAG: septum site-determining protein MinC [Syntrophaceticus sp.]|nr:septum site-determining protein MinC [Syntrophaceticus sp.]MDD3314253.1 septum site-determining protein MinC [Syntrophaceticus sp.]MDD4359848.1 septum site-determining protein MinC [Syntrophaceticus sp.]MDD4782411.1 septum site-determining protein MinC [Syntrophaceticus sp.]
MGKLVAIKGSRSRLIIKLDPEEDFHRVLRRFATKLREADDFLAGSTVSIDVGTRNLNYQQLSGIKRVLSSHQMHLYRIIIANNRGKCQGGDKMAEEVSERAFWRSRKKKKRKSKEQFQEQIEAEEEIAAIAEVSQVAEEFMLEITDTAGEPIEQIEEKAKEEKDDIPVILYAPVRHARDDVISQEQTILVQRTIRSGQRIFYPGNVVILGDVNPGGEVIAGGNIINMGTFRGIAHAGALGKADAIVAALRLEPSQLRIAGYITRAPEGDYTAFQPEIARVQDGIVIIEQYQPGYDRNHRCDNKGGS